MSDTALTPGRARILLVDDDHDVRASLRRALAQAGHNVVEAGSGEAAAAVIRQAAPFDMLVTDVRMPGRCDGVALASRWRERAPGRPVLFVSGEADGRLDVAALGPHEAVLPKPFQRAALLDVVQRLLAGRLTAAAPALAPAGRGGAAPPEGAPQPRWRARACSWTSCAPRARAARLRSSSS